MKTLLFAAALVTSAMGAPESDALSTSKNLLAQKNFKCANSERSEAFWKLKSFKSRHGNKDGVDFKVRFSKLGCGKGSKGSIVIAPGRTESSVKYIEAAHDFIKKGYSPVYAIDHRGQGFSPRVLENHNKGFVENFDFFIDDFQDFVDQQVLTDTDTNKKNLFLISNSMGGAISTLYLQRVSEKSPFKATALMGAMIKINLQGAVPYFEWAARYATYKACNGSDGLAGLVCKDYVQKTWMDYDASSRVLDTQNPNPYNMTHSLARFNYRNYLWDELAPMNTNHSATHQADEHWNGLPLGGPTTHWMWQATKANMEMRKSKEVKKIKTPYIVITGTQDVRAVLKAHKKFCKKVEKKGAGCTYYPIEGAYHELMIESDEYRSKTLNLVWDFFDKFIK